MDVEQSVADITLVRSVFDYLQPKALLTDTAQGMQQGQKLKTAVSEKKKHDELSTIQGVS